MHPADRQIGRLRVWTRDLSALLVRAGAGLVTFFLAATLSFLAIGVPRPPSPLETQRTIIERAVYRMWTITGVYNFTPRPVPVNWRAPPLPNGEFPEMEGYKPGYSYPWMPKWLWPLHNVVIALCYLAAPFALAVGCYAFLTNRYVEPRCGTCGRRLRRLPTACCALCGSAL